jgi:hypothetical protein
MDWLDLIISSQSMPLLHHPHVDFHEAVPAGSHDVYQAQVSVFYEVL